MSVSRLHRDFYCGQCGKKSHEGYLLEICHCADGRAITELRYCVFCGEPLVNRPEYVPHRCGIHVLRNYWQTPYTAKEAPEQRRQKTSTTPVSTLFEDRHE